MSDEDVTPVEIPPKPKPKLEPKEKDSIDKAVKGVLGWIEKRKAQSKASTVAPASKPWGWVVGLIVAVVVLVSLALVAFWAWRKGREIAKLKHQIDVDKERKIEAKVDAELARDEAEKKKLDAEALRLKVKIDRTKDEVRHLEAERKAAHAKIDTITSWADVDALLGEDNEN
jgi:septal ring factor EnvC (AmiA/AmiB activator)